MRDSMSWYYLRYIEIYWYLLKLYWDYIGDLYGSYSGSWSPYSFHLDMCWCTRVYLEVCGWQFIIWEYIWMFGNTFERSSMVNLIIYLRIYLNMWQYIRKVIDDQFENIFENLTGTSLLVNLTIYLILSLTIWHYIWIHWLSIWQ